ncbi:MAG: NPCBM/NEW2 domain-containing protein [Ruminococcus sp.]|nr:NPCBM/NEW2 domain-containing protein [Ruminococcus sp.]
MKKKRVNLKLKITSGLICSVILLIGILYNYNNKINSSSEFKTSVYTFAAATPKNNEFIYLSDINYIANQSKTAWGSILKDKTSSGGKISVKIEGAYYSFDKGMWAHATSTLVYDISAYNYDYFTAYAGLNQTAASSSNGVKFYVYTSTDGKNWDLKTPENPPVKKAGNEAEFLKVDIKGAKYLKLIANDNGANGNDHAVYADAKLTNSAHDDNVVQSVSYYDELIKEKNKTNGIDNKELELLLLQRDFVNKVGQFALRRYVNEDPENEVTLNWLFNDLENLREFILGGTPDGGSYYNALTVLTRLYKNYKTDLDNKTLLNNKWDPTLTYGDLYRKMMFAISLTHSQRVGLWMQSGNVVNQSDPVRRYAIFRYLHKNNKFVVTRNTDGTPNIDITPWFESLRVEEMRFVLYNNIDDEEILWLNDYVQSKIDDAPGRAWSLLTPHPYMAYVWPNYQNQVYYAEENVEYFNELFAVPDENDSTKKIGMFDVSYTIPGGTEQSEYTIKITRGTPTNKVYKVWMNFRNKFGTGAVCGGISKSGANIRGTHGIPAAVIGQPGHAALLYYTKNNDGKGYWRIDNDVSGWTKSEKGERMLLGWGNASYQKGYSVVYMELSQTAINDFDNLVKAEETIMLAKSYQDDLDKQEELYREALRIQPINIDAWYGLIQTFNANDNKTEKDYYDLASDLADKLMPFPLPMYHLTNLIKSKLTSPEYIYQFTLLQTRTLTEGSALPNSATNIVLQPGVTRTEANYLLGNLDKTIATFSFDGDNAGNIVLSSRFDGAGVRWDYSLDGKETWKEVSFTGEEPHKLQLSPEEIASITEENDIYVHIVGVNYDEENLYKIDITKPTISSTLYGNDLENRVIGISLAYEWSNNENGPWTSYADSSPNNSGNKTLYVRVAASGTALASDSKTFTFTEDNQPDTAKYIPIRHLSIEGYSTQSKDSKRPFYAPNAIDGNLNTLWHTDFAINVLQQQEKPFITIKLDAARYISALEFIQVKYKTNNPDSIKNMRVYVSEDGENWTLAGTKDNIPQENDLYRIDFAESVYGGYVKLEMDTYNMFASLAMVNLFEDITENPPSLAPTADIGYSTTEITNGDVIARLVNPSTEIKILNNNGSDTYTFTEEGSFTFEFIDASCEENCSIGRITAKVNWIDKNAPTASVSYDKEGKTNGEVTATLTNISESIYILDSHDKITGYIEVENEIVESITYYDDKEEITKIVYVDSDMQVTSIEYYNNGHAVYITELNKDGVITKETFLDSEGNVIDPDNKEEYRKFNQVGRTNPLENTFTTNGTYIFTIKDKAGNISNVMAVVNNIDTTIPMADIKYNITTTTDKNVIATLTDATEEITIINNDGKDTYTFTENGEFTFEFRDEAGNIGKAVAKVDWIKEKTEDNKPSDGNNTDKPDDNKPGDDNNNDNNDNPNDNATDDDNNNNDDNINNDNEDSNTNNPSKPNTKPSNPSAGNNSDKVDSSNNSTVENPKTNDYFPMYRGMIIFGIVILGFITKKLI